MVPFLAGSCGVCDHAFLQTGSPFAGALPREGWVGCSCEEKGVEIF